MLYFPRASIVRLHVMIQAIEATTIREKLWRPQGHVRALNVLVCSSCMCCGASPRETESILWRPTFLPVLAQCGDNIT